MLSNVNLCHGWHSWCFLQSPMMIYVWGSNLAYLIVEVYKERAGNVLMRIAARYVCSSFVDDKHAFVYHNYWLKMAGLCVAVGENAGHQLLSAC